ncbi:MAG: hypothetical protein WDN25_03980 [Acetobacteraceae bacterium]
MPPQNPFSLARIESLTRRIRANTREQIVALTNELTARNQALIAGASAGSTVPFTRYVDGVLGKPLDQVRADGMTLTEFHLLGHVVDAAIRMLIERSPFGPAEGGHYRDDHRLYVNGQRRDATKEGTPVEIKQTDQVVILNPRPYARKIEGGARERFRGRMTNRRPGLSVQAPDGVYEITVRELRQRFGNIAVIGFTYRAAFDGAVVDPAAVPKAILGPYQRNRQGRFVAGNRAAIGGRPQHNVSSERFPAIEITGRT